MTLAIFLGSLLGSMALGIPIAFALLVVSVALMFYLDLFDAQIIAQNLLNGADSFPLMAVPFFMLAGEVMNVGGLSKRIVNIAMALVTSRSSPPACWRRFPVRPWPMRQRWRRCWCR
jgi:TRAP-type mannitol/chloroaromatic compound transport system permease large subunit